MKRITIQLFLFLSLPIFIWSYVQQPFVILITSYNNEEVCEKNIRSALGQDYDNFRIIFVNDCSSDKTFELVEKTVKEKRHKMPVILVNNSERHKALENIYRAIHDRIRDEEIVVSLDGDDLLATPQALRVLNSIYSNPRKEVWLTYGQFTQLCSGHRGWNIAMPDDVVKNGTFRTFTHCPSHLRTFKAGLFKKIKEEDLMYNGEFFPMAWDMAMMIPMIEMARHNHFEFIQKTLYIYNDGNSLSDHNVNVNLQRECDRVIRAMPPYDALESL